MEPVPRSDFKSLYIETLGQEVKETEEFLQAVAFASKMPRHNRLQGLVNQINGSILQVNSPSLSDWGARVSALSRQSSPLSSSLQAQEKKKQSVVHPDEAESRITSRQLSFCKPEPSAKRLTENVGKAIKDALISYGAGKIPIHAEIKRPGVVYAKSSNEGLVDIIAETIAVAVVIRTLALWLTPNRLILAYAGARIIKAFSEEGRNALPQDLDKSLGTTPEYGVLTGRQVDVLLQIAALPCEAITASLQNLEIVAKLELKSLGITNERINKVANAFCETVTHGAKIESENELKAHLRMLEEISNKLYDTVD